MYRIYIYKSDKINYQLQVRMPTQSTYVHALSLEPISVATQDLDIMRTNLCHDYTQFFAMCKAHCPVQIIDSTKGIQFQV